MYRIVTRIITARSDAWCIYPMYETGLTGSGFDERVTPSIFHAGIRRTTARFTIGSSEALDVYHPRQVEFATTELELHV